MFFPKMVIIFGWYNFQNRTGSSMYDMSICGACILLGNVFFSKWEIFKAKLKWKNKKQLGKNRLHKSKKPPDPYICIGPNQLGPTYIVTQAGYSWPAYDETFFFLHATRGLKPSRWAWLQLAIPLTHGAIDITRFAKLEWKKTIFSWIRWKAMHH